MLISYKVRRGRNSFMGNLTPYNASMSNDIHPSAQTSMMTSVETAEAICRHM